MAIHSLLFTNIHSITGKIRSLWSFSFSFLWLSILYYCLQALRWSMNFYYFPPQLSKHSLAMDCTYEPQSSTRLGALWRVSRLWVEAASWKGDLSHAEELFMLHCIAFPDCVALLFYLSLESSPLILQPEAHLLENQTTELIGNTSK